MAIDATTLNGAARSAYAKSKTLTGEGNGIMEANKKAGSTFSDMLTDASKEAVSVIRNADAITQKGIRGEVSVQEVVHATVSAETTLNTIVGIRDKVVQSYQEILRMPI
jgi:flagellar hook-basal body complex protein FliE